MFLGTVESDSDTVFQGRIGVVLIDVFRAILALLKLPPSMFVSLLLGSCSFVESAAELLHEGFNSSSP